MRKLLYLFFILNAASVPLFSQSEDDQFMPAGLGFSNQLEYSYDIKLKREIFENWLNVDYRKSIFSAGVRFDLFQPNDPDPSISRGKEKFAGIDYKYLKAEFGNTETGGEITVGNYYALFGRGMLLKSYEDRFIRVDNNLLGVKFLGRYKGLTLTALTGMAENSQAERKDIIHAADIDYHLIKNIRLGASIASNQPDADGAARNSLLSIRIQPNFWNFDFYGEYGVRLNDDIKEKKFKNKEKFAGKAFYGGTNFYFGNLAGLVEYKYYDNFSFTSNDGTIFYNTPPAVRKEYAYILLNRHPSPLNANNEQGFQVELNYGLSDDTYLTANYGLTKTLPPSSLYQRSIGINNSVRTQLQEFYLQAQQTWNDKFQTIAGFAYYEELDANTKSITPVLDNRFYFDDINTIRLILEHQQVTNRTTTENYYDDVIMLEYLRSPNLSISVVAEVQSREPQVDRIVRKVWGFLQIGYKFWSHTDFSILFGTRQAGNICIGGICRYEPEFSGMELKMTTRF